MSPLLEHQLRLHVRKAIYGLPRSGSDFAAHVKKELMLKEWSNDENEISVFWKDVRGARVAIVAYVDDFLIMGYGQ